MPEKWTIKTAEDAAKWGDWKDPNLANAVRDIERHLTAGRGMWGRGNGNMMCLKLNAIRKRHDEALAVPEFKDCSEPEKAKLLTDLLTLLDEIKDFDFNMRHPPTSRLDDIGDIAISVADRITLKILRALYPND